MRAVICTGYGSPAVLRMVDLPRPVPRDDEVLVRVVCTTVHIGDTRIRRFDVPRWQWFPARAYLGVIKPRRAILGMELAGVIEAVGSRVTTYQAGDEVIACTAGCGFGTYADYRCLPANLQDMAPRPRSVGWDEAAALPAGGLTALRVLRNAHIGPGSRVLVYGASGSVGTFAVQLARHAGATVTGVCSAANRDLVASLGASDVLDYAAPEFAPQEGAFDVVFDAVGKAPRQRARTWLRPGGTYIDVLRGPYPEQPDDLATLVTLVDSGALRPVIDRVYPLERIAEAHAYMDGGHKKVNVVIEVAPAGLITLA